MTDIADPTFRTKPSPLPAGLQHEIEQYYAWEARLLNDRRYDEWFVLLAADIRHVLPSRPARIDRERSTVRDHAHVEHDLKMMLDCIDAIRSGPGRVVDPTSRTRYLVSNVIVAEREGTTEYDVASDFIVCRSCSGGRDEIWSGERRDVLRQIETSAGFELVRRTLHVDQGTAIPNVPFFF